MKLKFALLSYIIIGAVGTLSHFAYSFFNVDMLKIIFPSNESIFEHLKLLVFPVIFFIPFDMILFKESSTFSSYISGILAGLVFIVSAYYIYTGIIGKNFDVVNILIYFVALAVVFSYRYKKITLFDFPNSVIAFILIIAFIEVFTFYTPNISFFNVP